MNRIAQYRTEKNLSQRALAKKLGVSSATVAMWETEKRTPRLKMAKYIAQFFETDIETIFFDHKDNIT
ncbi:helix-turn-helix transcriptional regulator [Fusibacter ferrireducens]|uniref:Helix-turn-helix domain-containing protein n=1 Tax=Fusibacter ferrireducens TaxID=2785058 RepID=A0ABR9ZTU8_9FIRM|nr:helix-turn-helix domain-containing protein [Fusibacter ferrireducens]MBF4693884.1 helix-turn-helix domain-containing protein [Fusibacter ferrireducens]